MLTKCVKIGLVPVEYDGVQRVGATSYTPAQKRKLDKTGFGVPDSEDEYGWEEEDTSLLPGQPPQWQGSEDVILGTRPDSDDDDNDGNEASDLDPESAAENDGERA